MLYYFNFDLDILSWPGRSIAKITLEMTFLRYTPLKKIVLNLFLRISV